jgi:hypothetical protein
MDTVDYENEPENVAESLQKKLRKIKKGIRYDTSLKIDTPFKWTP